MCSKNKVIMLAIISIILLVNSGCNLLISLIEPNTPPVAMTCQDYSILINEKAILDGCNSYDQDGDDLSFSWTILSQPRESQLENYDIIDRFTSRGYIILQNIGIYEFKLTVSDSIDESSHILRITVDTLPISGIINKEPSK